MSEYLSIATLIAAGAFSISIGMALNSLSRFFAAWVQAVSRNPDAKLGASPFLGMALLEVPTLVLIAVLLKVIFIS